MFLMVPASYNKEWRHKRLTLLHLAMIIPFLPCFLWGWLHQKDQASHPDPPDPSPCLREQWAFKLSPQKFFLYKLFFSHFLCFLKDAFWKKIFFELENLKKKANPAKDTKSEQTKYMNLYFYQNSIFVKILSIYIYLYLYITFYSHIKNRIDLCGVFFLWTQTIVLFIYFI